MIHRIIWALILLLAVSCVSNTSKNELAEFPEGYTPEETGILLTERFIPSKHYLNSNCIVYPEVCAWLGALRFAEVTRNSALTERLKNRFETLFSSEKEMQPPMNHVDFNMFGSLPFELYQITKEKKYLDLGLRYADSQWETPSDVSDEGKNWAEKGLTWQTRMWIDDMYMITIVQSQAYKATGDRKYIDRTAKEMAVYLDELQRPNGLFYHAPDVPFFWGRGNGWMAAGMTELLKLLPEDNPDRPRIMKGYLTMMASLKQYQTEGGMWNQLVDDPECWAETSGTAMFTYAMFVGVKKGWLEAKEYAPTARKAWMALIPYINEDGDVTEICIGTNKKNDRQYYYDRPRMTGDFHGQAPVLWCAFALLDK
jgi:rhamnogalacturonyl hydrolase YesR